MARIELRALGAGCGSWAIVGAVSAALHGVSSALVVVAVAALVDVATTMTSGTIPTSGAWTHGQAWIPLACFVGALLGERVALLLTGLSSAMCSETSAAQMAYRRLLVSQKVPSGYVDETTSRGEADNASFVAALKDAQARLPEVWSGIFAVVRRTMMLASALALIAWHSVWIAAVMLVVSVLTMFWELRQGKLLAEPRSRQRLCSAQAARVREVALVERFTAEFVFLNVRGWLTRKHQELSLAVTRVARKLLQRVLTGVFVATLLRGMVLVVVTVLLVNQLATGQTIPALFVAQVLAIRLASNAASILQSTWSGLETNMQMVSPYLHSPQAGADSKSCLASSRKSPRRIAAVTDLVVQVTNLKTSFAQVSDYGHQDASGVADSKPTGLNISHLSVSAGEKVVLLGENGSGKTTLLESLIGLRSPESGDVLIAGMPAAQACSERIVYVMPQSPLKLPISLRDNVCCGIRVDDETVLRACERVGLPMGETHNSLTLDTVLSARHGGQDLSGGQWQRVALARMLVHVQACQPVLVLMDEPVSAADIALEELVPRLCSEELGDVATIAITHRLSLAQDADTVWVMARGQIVEQGTPKSLLSRKGIYKTWLELQRSEHLTDRDGTNIEEGA